MQHTSADTDDPSGWPTTLRFSRRMGEATRGAEYAMAIEGPRWRPPSPSVPWWSRLPVLGAFVSADTREQTR